MKSTTIAKLLAVALSAALTAKAEIIEFIGEPSSFINANGLSVPVYDQANIHHRLCPAGGAPVFKTGAGIRAVKKVFITFNAYVAVSYVDRQAGISKTDPIGSLKDMTVRALHLTMLRDISADEIRTSWEDALAANDVDLESPGIQSLLSQITFDMPAGSTATLVGYTDDTMDDVTVETSLGHTPYAADKDLTINMWRVWFGVPVDSLMARLKQNLIGN